MKAAIAVLGGSWSEKILLALGERAMGGLAVGNLAVHFAGKPALTPAGSR